MERLLSTNYVKAKRMFPYVQLKDSFLCLCCVKASDKDGTKRIDFDL